jgi:WD40 repeat protein
MSETRRGASDDKVPNALCKKQRLHMPTRVTSLTIVDIARALAAIPGELGKVLGQKILVKRIDCDQLLDWLNSIEVKAEEPIVTDVFCKHSNLLLPFLDRVSLNHLCIANKQIRQCSRSVTLPWPQTLLHVGSPVKSVEFSHDGEWLACGTLNGMVRLWNRRHGRCTIVEGHTRAVAVKCVTYSADGKFLASLGRDGSIVVSNLDAQSHRRLESLDERVNSIAFSPSGSSLASGSDGGEVRLWDFIDGRCTRTFSTIPGGVCSVAFSPDGATLAAGGGTHSISCWDLVESEHDSSSPSKIIKTNGQYPERFMYSPNGIFMAYNVGYSIKILRLSDGIIEKNIISATHAYAFECFTFSPNGKLVASGNDDGTVRLWTTNDQEDAECLVVSPYVLFHGPITGEVKSVAFTPNGQFLAAGGYDDNIFLWDTRKFL